MIIAIVPFIVIFLISYALLNRYEVSLVGYKEERMNTLIFIGAFLISFLCVVAGILIYFLIASSGLFF